MAWRGSPAAGMLTIGHTWLHDTCWPAWYAKRRGRPLRQMPMRKCKVGGFAASAHRLGLARAAAPQVGGTPQVQHWYRSIGSAGAAVPHRATATETEPANHHPDPAEDQPTGPAARSTPTDSLGMMIGSGCFT